MDEVELTQELVRINSENPPGNEKEIANFIQDYIQGLKIDSELVKFGDNRYNIVASVGKGKDGLMLNTHMDTVPVGNLENWKYDPFSGKIIDGKIYGRGSNDSKGGIAAILSAVKEVSNEKMNRKLLINFVGDEEVAQGGSKFLIKNRGELFKNIKYGVVADADFKITTAQKGPMHVKFIFRGKAAHGSRPELGVNAITKATKFIEEIDKNNDKLLEKKDKILGRGTINIGMISGGTKVNIVPDLCEVSIDRRLTYGESAQFALNQFKKILKRLNLTAEVELISSPRLAVKIPANSEIVKLLQKIGGLKIGSMGGYNEMELYYRNLGIECVSFSVCNDSAHSANEFVRISDLKKAKYIFENLIRKWCI